MDRRSFISTCSVGAALQLAAKPVFAQTAQVKRYARVALVDEAGRPVRAAQLRKQVNYVFHYPYAATPAFLLDLGRPVAGQTLPVQGRGSTRRADWPGGVGSNHSIVAYCAICTHKLVYPTRDVSFISFRKDRARRGVQNGLIHCCSEQSQYDPAHGAAVITGPAPQPLTAILLAHDPQWDGLVAYGTLGGEVYDAFFDKYAARLQLENGSDVRKAAVGQAVVRELEKFTRNSMQC